MNKINKKESKKAFEVPSLVKDFIIPFLQFITAVAVGIVAYNSFIVTERNTRITERNNIITDTANLLNIHNSIQLRMDTLLSITNELEIFEISSEAQNIVRRTELKNRQTDAIYAFLNNFEFACQQYLADKIDKDAFKMFYNTKTLRRTIKKYEDRITTGTYLAIMQVLDEWPEAK